MFIYITLLYSLCTSATTDRSVSTRRAKKKGGIGSNVEWIEPEPGSSAEQLAEKWTSSTAWFFLLLLLLLERCGGDRGSGVPVPDSYFTDLTSAVKALAHFHRRNSRINMMKGKRNRFCAVIQLARDFFFSCSKRDIKRCFMSLCIS